MACISLALVELGPNFGGTRDSLQSLAGASQTTRGGVRSAFGRSSSAASPRRGLSAAPHRAPESETPPKKRRAGFGAISGVVRRLRAAVRADGGDPGPPGGGGGAGASGALGLEDPPAPAPRGGGAAPQGRACALFVALLAARDEERARHAGPCARACALVRPPGSLATALRSISTTCERRRRTNCVNACGRSSAGLGQSLANVGASL